MHVLLGDIMFAIGGEGMKVDDLGSGLDFYVPSMTMDDGSIIEQVTVSGRSAVAGAKC